MSVLRRVKLRTPDGIESIEYPLGVEAENVEVANGENLSQRLVRIDEDLEKNEKDIAAVSELAGTNKQNIGANEIRIDALERRSASVDKKPYYYNSVADMKADTKLKVGDMAITLGYYEANDGGAGEYKIVSGDYTDDGGKYHKLNNNLFAELIIKNFLPEQFGAYGDGINNDYPALSTAITTYKNKKKVLSLNSSSNYYLGHSLYIPSNTVFDGKRATLKTLDNSLNIKNDEKNVIIKDIVIDAGYAGVVIGDQALSQEYSVYPNHNVILNNHIKSQHGNRLRVGVGGNTHGKNIFALNNIETTGNQNADVGIESWNGDSTIALNSIMKTGDAIRTGSSGITFGHYDGQKALFNIVEGFNYGIESGGTKKNTLIFGNTIRNCHYGIGLTSDGTEKDIQIAFNYIEVNENDDIAIPTRGTEDVHIMNSIIEWVGDSSVGGIGVSLTGNSRRLFIDNCIFKNLNSPINAVPTVEEIIISNCKFLNCSNRLLGCQAKHVIIDKCYFEDCGVLYQYSNNEYFSRFIVSNSIFKHNDTWTGQEYVLSGRGLNTIGVMESNNNTFINCIENPMKPNTVTDGANKRPVLFKRNGLYYSYNCETFSDLLNLLNTTNFEFQPGDKVYDNYLRIEYIIKYPQTRYGTDFIHEEYNRSAQPSAGSFIKGDRIYNNYTTDTTVNGWVCTKSGTFGTETEPIFTTF